MTPNALKHGLYSADPSAHVRHAHRIETRVRRLRQKHPHLKEAPLSILERYVEVQLVGRKVSAYLLSPDISIAESSRLLQDYTRLTSELRRMATALGLVVEGGDDRSDPQTSLIAEYSAQETNGVG